MITSLNAKINGALTEDEVLELYDEITEIIDYNISKANNEKSKSKWIDTQDKIDGFLSKRLLK